MKKQYLLLLLALILVLSVGCQKKDEREVEKPVIYLYPEVASDVSVVLDYAGQLTCTYPVYQDGWQVTARPDGSLVNKADGKAYSYLFWEGTGDVAFDMSRGFVVAGTDTAAFLEDKLSLLGLNAAERNDFITYWLPRMQQNNYNLIAFQGDNYTDYAKLTVTPQPDSILRVFMAFQALDAPIDIEEQLLTPTQRNGFTLVEWGGCQLEQN
ncbi:MAG: hypothetical protein CSA05_03380 [Bacteroidia bacterium]|nr:MAG: hypothetical protein CSA05_03380 [Bacteroidia bacterium]